MIKKFRHEWICNNTLCMWQYSLNVTKAVECDKSHILWMWQKELVSLRSMKFNEVTQYKDKHECDTYPRQKTELLILFQTIIYLIQITGVWLKVDKFKVNATEGIGNNTFNECGRIKRYNEYDTYPRQSQKQNFWFLFQAIIYLIQITGVWLKVNKFQVSSDSQKWWINICFFPIVIWWIWVQQLWSDEFESSERKDVHSKCPLRSKAANYQQKS